MESSHSSATTAPWWWATLPPINLRSAVLPSRLSQLSDSTIKENWAVDFAAQFLAQPALLCLCAQVLLAQQELAHKHHRGIEQKVLVFLLSVTMHFVVGHPEP